MNATDDLERIAQMDNIMARILRLTPAQQDELARRIEALLAELREVGTHDNRQ